MNENIINEGIGNFENMVARVVAKVRNKERLDLDDKLDYCVALYEINKALAAVEKDSDLRIFYESQTQKYLRKARKYEEKLEIRV
jgi:hypothetical protein